MELNKINSLVELFFEKSKEKKLESNQSFLKWLKNEKEDFYTWSQVEYRIQILQIAYSKG